MIIDVACENEMAYVRCDEPTINFPIVFTFMDRTSGILVRANLNLDAFKYLMKTLRETNLDKIDEIEKKFKL